MLVGRRRLCSRNEVKRVSWVDEEESGMAELLMSSARCSVAGTESSRPT